MHDHEIDYTPTPMEIERREVITKLLSKVSNPNVVTVMLENNKVWTKKGRINKSGLMRFTGLPVFEIEKIFEEMRNILKNEY